MKQNRREFILGLSGLVFAGCQTAGGAPATVVPSPSLALGAPDLHSIYAATRALHVVSGRWQIIVGHHSGIWTGNAAIYDRVHRARGMEHGLAYHFVIGNGTKSGDGEIEIGGRWMHQLAGGHVRDEHVNEVGIGICCVGNFEETPPTVAQLHSFTTLVDYLEREVIRTPVQFAVHREIDPGHTVCPGRQFPVAAMHARFG